MKAPIDLTFQQRSMVQQGYQCYAPHELKQYEWGLRFTPTICMGLTILALFLGWWWLNFTVAGLGSWAFFAPAGHPMDLIYNHAVRHIFGAAKLPPNPLQRRLACLSAGVLNVVIGALFLAALPVAAYVAGAVLVTLQVIVITTHFCTLSWMYELGMRALGKWELPLTADQARKKLTDGAMLVDVRSRAEFTRERLVGARNVPVEELDENLEHLAGPVLVYCASGMRSQIAAHKLADLGLNEVFDIGGIGQLKATFGTESGAC